MTVANLTNLTKFDRFSIKPSITFSIWRKYRKWVRNGQVGQVCFRKLSLQRYMQTLGG